MGLSEIRRVLKPKGKVVMIEHMKSRHAFLAFFEDILNPLTRFLVGVNINRDTPSNIRKAGLKIREMRNIAFFDVFRVIVAGKGK